MHLLDGKKALVSGVTNQKSIAWGIAQALRSEGAQLAFTCLDTNVRRLKKLAPMVASELIIPCDIRNDHEIEEVFHKVGEAFCGRLDILIHSIAYADLRDLGGEFIRTPRARWGLALELSAYSLVAFANHARPLMNAVGGGSIITLTFTGGELVVPGYNIMGVAKAALDATVRYLAYDLGPENIRVNAISPGPILTPSSMVIEDFGTVLKMIEERSPLLRNIKVEDVGGAAVYLASDLSRCVTGAVIKVDSGMNIIAAPTKVHPRHRPSGIS